MSKPILDVIQTVHQLRAPGGCPWDREQTHQSLRTFLIEESSEVLDVLDSLKKDEQVLLPEFQEPLKEELGDLLLQILLHSEIANEKGAFSFSDVAQSLNEKLIRRHPHVFAQTAVKDAEEVLQNWEQIKSKEKEKKKDPSILAGLPKGLPALSRAFKVIEKVSRVGFQWKDISGPLEKLREEIKEFEQEVSKLGTLEEIKKLSSETKIHLEGELGDILFCISNLGFFLGINPEDALRGTQHKFENRFRYVEKMKTPNATLEEMDKLWDKAKALERK